MNIKNGFKSFMDRIFGENVKHLSQADIDAYELAFLGGVAFALDAQSHEVTKGFRQATDLYQKASERILNRDSQ